MRITPIYNPIIHPNIPNMPLEFPCYLHESHPAYFLLQLSIVVLLARPQKVHVISQADYLTGMDTSSSGERSSEAAAWLDKRIHHLKDEMFMVEARIERMQREYLQLKAQLKDLEHLLQLNKPR